MVEIFLWAGAILIQKCRLTSTVIPIIRIRRSDGRFIFITHDDVIKWKQFPRNCPFVPLCGEGQWRGALMFSLICAWINVWVNNCEAGDLTRYRTHYDVTVMRNSYTRKDSLYIETGPRWRIYASLNCAISSSCYCISIIQHQTIPEPRLPFVNLTLKTNFQGLKIKRQNVSLKKLSDLCSLTNVHQLVQASMSWHFNHASKIHCNYWLEAAAETSTASIVKRDMSEELCKYKQSNISGKSLQSRKKSLLNRALSNKEPSVE